MGVMCGVPGRVADLPVSAAKRVCLSRCLALVAGVVWLPLRAGGSFRQRGHVRDGSTEDRKRTSLAIFVASSALFIFHLRDSVAVFLTPEGGGLLAL